VGAFVGGAFGVINKTIRQLGAYIQTTVSKRCKPADRNHPTRASRATKYAGENYAHPGNKKEKETLLHGGKYLTSVQNG
jgi:hypothetical protein